MDPPNPWSFGIELARPAQHMRLWFSLQVLGTDMVDEMIGRGFELSTLAADEIKTALRLGYPGPHFLSHCKRSLCPTWCGWRAS
ncbi:hypothetical protein BDV26DRAFT_268177 [Aspergillus bertholletiae]|uniref:Uncharacterized protein n=1 Tax=Aspergillus bertholletiae TaxID=1226010 RepID=A0A5N7AZW0_9EURO|nr:hypothetical protein BDV26DRAFT_268177 [Aspergillus bertholletiae]